MENQTLCGILTEEEWNTFRKIAISYYDGRTESHEQQFFVK